MKDYKPWKFADKAICHNCGKPIYYSVEDTVWLHYNHQYFCDGEYGHKDTTKFAEESKL